MQILRLFQYRLELLQSCSTQKELFPCWSCHFFIWSKCRLHVWNKVGWSIPVVQPTSVDLVLSLAHSCAIFPLETTRDQDWNTPKYNRWLSLKVYHWATILGEGSCYQSGWIFEKVTKGGGTVVHKGSWWRSRHILGKWPKFLTQSFQAYNTEFYNIPMSISYIDIAYLVRAAKSYIGDTYVKMKPKLIVYNTYVAWRG